MTSMNGNPSKGQLLERQLGCLFGALDAKPDFDARLMARIQAEADAQGTADSALANARIQAQKQYRSAAQRLLIMRRWMLQLLTLDTLAAVATLLAVGSMLAQTTSVNLSAMLQSATNTLSQYGPVVGTVLGILATLIPFAALVVTEKIMNSRKNIEV